MRWPRTSTSFSCGIVRGSAPSLRPGLRRRPGRVRADDLAEKVDLSRSRFEVRVSLSVVVVEEEGPEVLAVLHEELDRRRADLRRVDRLPDDVLRELPAVDGDDLHPGADAGLVGRRSREDVDDGAGLLLHAEPERVAEVHELM